MVDALHDVEPLRDLAEVDSENGQIADEVIVGEFRQFLEKHQLVDLISSALDARLEHEGLRLSRGIMADASLVNVLSKPSVITLWAENSVDIKGVRYK